MPLEELSVTALGSVAALYTLISMITFIIYYLDKSAAKNGRWRTTEKTLHLLSLFGGWPGAILAQRLFRHKTKKRHFRLVFGFTVVLNISLLCWLMVSSKAIAALL